MAERCYTEAIAISPLSTDCDGQRAVYHSNRAACLIQMGRFDGKEISYITTVEQDKSTHYDTIVVQDKSNQHNTIQYNSSTRHITFTTIS